MPFYLVCDVSGSMSNDMGALNSALRDLRSTIVREPVIADVVRVGVISFSDTAHVEVPIGDTEREVTLSVQGGTNYGNAFRMLAETIEKDVEELKRQNYRVYRSMAFFLTDGQPTDVRWKEDFDASLTYNTETCAGFKAYPCMVPFGFRDAQHEVLGRLAYPPKVSKYYMANGTAAAEAIRGLIEVMRHTVLSSGLNASSATPKHVLTKASTPAVSQHESQYPGGDTL
ncbi:MAG: vWA domain-containing protein [Actinomycetales bacterium]